MRIQTTELFTCPMERLWTHITEPEKQKLWMKGVLSNDPITPEPQGVGSRSRMVIQEGRKKAVYDVEVTAYQQPHHLEVLITGGNFPACMKIRAEYRLAVQGAQTRLEYSCSAESTKVGLFMRLMFVVFRLFGKMQLRSFMRSLRKLVEAPPALAA